MLRLIGSFTFSRPDRSPDIWAKSIEKRLLQVERAKWGGYISLKYIFLGENWRRSVSGNPSQAMRHRASTNVTRIPSCWDVESDASTRVKKIPFKFSSRGKLFAALAANFRSKIKTTQSVERCGDVENTPKVYERTGKVWRNFGGIFCCWRNSS